MVERFKLRQANALKHEAYSTLGLLPGESPAAFKKYQKAVIDEFRPNGPVEHDVVFTIALALWRKQNLATLETAKLAKFRFSEIFEEELKSRGHFRLERNRHTTLGGCLLAVRLPGPQRKLVVPRWQARRDHDELSRTICHRSIMHVTFAQ